MMAPLGGRTLMGLALAVLMATAVLAAQGRLDPEQARMMAAEAENPLDAADILDRAWLHEAALDVLTDEPGEDAEVLWRRARSRVNIGENLGEDESAPHFETALAEAEKAVALDSASADAHLMVGVASGRVALLRGPFSASGLVKQAYHHAHLATVHGDSIPVAYYVLGRTHKKLMEKSGLVRKLAGLGFADLDSVEIYFDRALEISGGNMIQCHVEYAHHLIENRDDPDAAREHLEAALSLPVRDEQDVPALARAEEMLKALAD